MESVARQSDASGSLAPLTSRSTVTPIEWRFLLGTALVLLLAFRLMATRVLPVYDDAFITFRYARNLALGCGLVYQPHEWVLGVTCPAFGLLAALVYRSGLSLPQAIQGINILCDLLILSITVLLFVRKASIATAVLFIVLFCVSPIANRVCAGGMEADLFLLCALIAICCYHLKKTAAAVLIAALAYFIRPEAILLCGLLCVLAFRDYGWKTSLRVIAIAVASMLIPFLAIFHTYGHLFPQSVMAKSHAINTPIMEVLTPLFAPDPLCLLLIPFAVYGGVIVFRQAGAFRTIALWGILHSLAYLIARPHIWSWYGEPIYYTMLLLGACGIGAIVPRWVRLPRVRWWYAALCVLLLGLVVGVGMKAGPSKVSRNVYRPMDAWCRQHMTPQSTMLATDIGAIGYFSRARIYDTAGLVWPRAFDYPTLDMVITKLSPQYLLLNATADTVALMSHAPFSRQYRPVARFSPTQQRNLDLSAETFPRGWVQDYLLFQRE